MDINRLFLGVTLFLLLCIPYANGAEPFSNSAMTADVELISSDESGMELSVIFDDEIVTLLRSEFTLAGTESSLNALNSYSITKLIRLPDRGNPIITGVHTDYGLTGNTTESVQIGKVAIMRGIRVAQVTLSPVLHNESDDVVGITDGYDVQISYDEPTTNPVERAERPHSPEFNRFLDAVLLNPPDRDDDYPYGGSWLYLVPDVEGVVDALNPLLEWRRQSGCSVQVEVAPDDRDGIKDIIQEAYDTWEIPPEYVVLVADADGEMRLQPWEDEEPVTDHPYVLLEGDDILPDATIGRLSWNTLDELTTIAEKIVSYESDPEIGDDAWLTHAVSCAATSASSSAILVGRWIREQMLEAGYDPVDTSFTVRDEEFAEWLQGRIGEGVSLILTRSMAGWSPDAVTALDNAPNLPLMLMVSANSGRFWRADPDDDSYPELLLRTEHGAVGALGSGHPNNRTAYANLFAGSIIQGLLGDRILSFGWSLNRAKFELYRQYNGLSEDPDELGVEWWETHIMMMNLMGDPGTKLWLGRPTSLEVDHEFEMNRGNNRLYVTALREADEEPIEGAVACLYNSDGLFLSGRTNSDGDYIFILPQNAMELESAQLTVTGDGLLPYIAEITFQDADHSIGVGELISINDGEGDGDEILDFAETVELIFSVVNYGNEPIPGPFSVSVEDRSPYYEVFDDAFDFNEDLEPGDGVELSVEIEIDPSCPNGVELRFDVLIVDGGDVRYRSGFTSISGAPAIEVDRFIFPEGRLEPGTDRELDIVLTNNGRQLLDPCDVELVSLSNMIRVDQGQGTYEEILIGEQVSLADDLFQIRGSPQAIPGTSAMFELRMLSDLGWQDTIRFEMEFAPARDGDPFDPDLRGYICYDSEDEEYEFAPQFDWVELDPDFDGEGDEIDFGDLAENRDHSLVIDMPFELTYYGEHFDQITVCTNGWIAPGSQPQFNDSRNRMLPTPLGTRGKICPFWDNLMGDDDSGIFSYYLEEEGLFIVQWSRMRHRVEDGEGAVETFQVVFYDREVVPTLNGDNQFAFQYLQVEDSREGYDWDTPYATVGIQGFSLDYSLLYCYWDEYVDGATQLEDELAILFTSNRMIFDPSSIVGSVLDAGTGDPMGGVEIEVTTELGFQGRTISAGDGSFVIDDLIAGAYDLIATFEGYNEYMGQVQVEAGDTARPVIEMLHPEFTLSSDSVLVSLIFESEDTQDVIVTVTNSGNGPLDFLARLRIIPPEQDRDDSWDNLLDIDLTEATGDDRITAVVWAGDQLWIAGGNQGQEPPLMYFFDRNGNYLDQAAQPYDHRWGMRGMAFDGEFVWGYGDIGLMQIDPDMNVVAEFAGPHNNGRGIAWDPASESLFLSGISGDNADRIFQVDREGNTITSFQHEYAVYGLSWFEDDQAGMPLYLTTNGWDGDDRTISIIRSDIEGQYEEVAQIQQGGDDRGGGCDISGEWRPELWSFISTVNSPGGDRLNIYELGTRASWVTLDTSSAELDAGGELDLTLTFSPVELEIGHYDAVVEFQHNAIGGASELPIRLSIEEEGSVRELQHPDKFELFDCFPNPFNSVTLMSFYLPEVRNVVAALYDINGRLVQQIVSEEYASGYHTINVDLQHLPSTVYLLRLNASEDVSYQKLVLIK